MTEQVQLALIASIAPTLAVLYNIYLTVKANQKIEAANVKIEETKKDIGAVKEQTDGMLTEIKKKTAEAADATGQLKGTADEQKRVAEQLATANAASSTPAPSAPPLKVVVDEPIQLIAPVPTAPKPKKP